MTNPEQFNELLNNLKEKNAQRTVNIWIPSLARGVEFRHLNLNQQKSLINSSIRENLLKLDFSRNIYDIIVTNIVDKEVDVGKLNIVDMISIGISYRAVDISDEYGFFLAEQFYPVDLNKLCETIRTTDYGDVFKTDTIVSDSYHVTVQVPYIHTDKLLNDHLFEKYAEIPDEAEELKEILADVYIHEACKYITNIDIVTEGDNPGTPPVEIDFTKLTAEQRLDVIEQIPLTVLNRLVSVSDKVQSIESKLLDVDLDGETATIMLNSAFFT
jgi:hypothetical protein